jgi:hypothetical protein
MPELPEVLETVKRQIESERYPLIAIFSHSAVYNSSTVGGMLHPIPAERYQY